MRDAAVQRTEVILRVAGAALIGAVLAVVYLRRSPSAPGLIILSLLMACAILLSILGAVSILAPVSQEPYRAPLGGAIPGGALLGRAAPNGAAPGSAAGFGDTWWQNADAQTSRPFAAQPPTATEATITQLPLLPKRPQGERIVQCPRCGAFAIHQHPSSVGFAFSCDACAQRWDWAPGEPRPATVIRPRLRSQRTRATRKGE